MRRLAFVIGYSIEKPSVEPQGFLSRIAGGLIGMLLATINTLIRSVCLILVTYMFIPVVFFSAPVIFYLYFYKQKQNNPLLSAVYSLFFSLYLIFEMCRFPISQVYALIAAPFIGFYYGQQCGFLQSIIDFRDAVFRLPSELLKKIIKIATLIHNFYKIVTLSQRDFKRLMIARNTETNRIMRNLIEAAIIKQLNLDINNLSEDNKRLINAEIMRFERQNRPSDVNKISLFKIFFSFYANEMDSFIPKIPKKCELELTDDEILKFTIDLSSSVNLDSDKTSLYTKLTAEPCPITLMVPSTSNKVLLFKQYKDEQNEWRAVPACSWVFDAESLKKWFTLFFRTNPCSGESIDQPFKHMNQYPTRYRMCKLHPNDAPAVFVCQELRELFPENTFSSSTSSSTTRTSTSEKSTNVPTNTPSDSNNRGTSFFSFFSFFKNSSDPVPEQTQYPSLNVSRNL